MAQTKLGGQRARDTNLANDPDFYKRIGRLGGSAKTSKPRGFAAMPREKVMAAGAKGGKKSRRS